MTRKVKLGFLMHAMYTVYHKFLVSFWGGGGGMGDTDYNSPYASG